MTNTKTHIDSNTAPQRSVAQNQWVSNDTIIATSNDTTETTKAKSLRTIMVSCIDHAIEELGSIRARDASPKLTYAPSLFPEGADVSNTAPSMPTAQDLYGDDANSKISSSSVANDQIRRRNRYQRRNSVTKFSLSCAMNEVQKDFLEGKFKGTLSSPSSTSPTLVGSCVNRHLWHHLYASKLGLRQNMKAADPSLEETVGTRSLDAIGDKIEMPTAKRRRGGIF